MSKISRALERAKKEREMRQKDHTKASKEKKAVDNNDETVVINTEDFSKEIAKENQVAQNTDVSLEPKIHDPELHRIKIRKRRRKKHSQTKTILKLMLAVIILCVIGVFLYLQIHDDPFETLETTIKKEPLVAEQSAPQEIATRDIVVSKAVAKPDVIVNKPIVKPTVVAPKVDISPIPRVVKVHEVAANPVRNHKSVASFNSGRRQNEVGGDFYAWTDNEAYPCNDYFNSFNARMGEGFSLKLAYNVDDPLEIVKNALVMDLGHMDTQKYKTFTFYLKGDRDIGFSKAVVVALQSTHKTRSYKLNNVTYRWEKVSIPLDAFKEDGEALKEFRLVFQTDIVTQGIGAVYIDDVRLEE
ncbi:hypothetical protein ACFL3D_03320 [Candidatus Omnitrophota bacterium]